MSESTEIGFYRAKQAADLLAIGKSTLWLWTQQRTVRGVDVPQPIKLSPGVTVWRKEDVHNFIENLSKIDEHST